MERPQRPTASFYRPELDALRFFAFLAVYLNHTVLLDPGHGAHWKRLLGGFGASGAFGVDLFFALSAYLITELLLRERMRTGKLDVRAFYVRRILRIWPLYFVFLAAMALLPMDGMTPHYALGFALFAGNWMYIVHPLHTMAAPLWSVSVEEQFYLLWPWAVRKGSAARIAWLAGGIAVLALATAIGLQLLGIGEPWISKNSITRADGIAFGVLLAVALRGGVPTISTRARLAMLCAALLALGLIGTQNPFEGGVHLMKTALVYPAAALLCVGILVAVLGAQGRLGRLLNHPALVYLGRISYGLYVFHQVGLAIADHEFPEHLHEVHQWIPHFALGLAITFALAAVSYKLLEQPFLRLKRRRYTIIESRPDSGPEHPEGQPVTAS
jgi:peptidoglycan/LPS O-acetylase OafA/YrhL